MAFQTFWSSLHSQLCLIQTLCFWGEGGLAASEPMEYTLQLKANISTSVTACGCFKKEKRNIKNINVKLFGILIYTFHVDRVPGRAWILRSW